MALWLKIRVRPRRFRVAKAALSILVWRAPVTAGIIKQPDWQYCCGDTDGVFYPAGYRISIAGWLVSVLKRVNEFMFLDNGTRNNFRATIGPQIASSARSHSKKKKAALSGAFFSEALILPQLLLPAAADGQLCCLC